MKKMSMVIVLSACLLSLLLAADVTQAKDLDKQAELLTSCQKLQQYLTLPPQTSAEQRALVALNIAVAQSQPLDESIDLAEVLRKASGFTVYGVISDTFYLWDGESWVGNHRSTYTYSGIRETSEVEQDWDGENWVNVNKTLTTYNVDGTQNTVTDQEWQTDHWENSSLATFGYSGGVLATMLMQTWSGSAWVNYSRSTLSYSGGNLATTITEMWQTSAWVNSLKSSYTYSGGLPTEWIIQSWIGGVWVNSLRYTSSYNGSGLITQDMMYNWQGGAWVSASKYDYTYDGSGNEILDVHSIADGASWTVLEVDTSKWSDGRMTEIVQNQLAPPYVRRTQFTYDGNGNRTVDLDQSWFESEWLNTDRAVYVYQALGVEAGNSRMPSVFELSQNYPNPFNPITAIRYSLHRPSQVSITVFNVLGQEVKTLESGIQSAGTYETTWDGTNQAGQEVASGIYFYRIKAGEFVETRKMVLLK